MLIKNPDALKNWLTIVLEPLCDADPSALARYVLALLKKEKPQHELLDCMADQLDVFLAAETRPFLDRLFISIQTEEYLRNIVIDETAATGVEPTPNVNPMRERETTPPLINSTTTDSPKQRDILVGERNGIEKHPPITAPIISFTATTATVITPSLSKSQEPSPIKMNADKDNHAKGTNARRRRASLRSRSRSRSRSYETLRRSRSRDRRLAEREKSSRSYRNKSPLMIADRRGGGGGGHRYDRNAPGANMEPRYYRGINTRSHSQSRSRSDSGDRRKISRSISPPPDGPPAKRQRCRDFDEKGYCMRGETCPWDHGTDPVVLEDINNPGLIIQGQPHGRGNGNGGGEYSPDAPEIWGRGGQFGGAGNGGGRNGPPGRGPPGLYPRGAPVGAGGGGVVGGGGGGGFRNAPPFPFPMNPSATTPLQRELISVPVIDANSGGDASAQSKRRYEPEDTVAIAEGPGPKRKVPINSRLGPRVNSQQNCSLELRKVPRGLNSIAHLNNHFSKFGKIVNIQISYDSDPEAAIITFSTHAEANVAYRSTEAVLNNRFIKVFWHSATNNNGNSDQTQTISKDENGMMGGGSGVRKHSQYHLNNVVPAVPTPTNTDNKVVASAQSTTPPTAQSAAAQAASASSAAAATALRIKTSRVNRAAVEIIRKKQEDQVKVAVQLAHGLHIRKHELLQEYIKQMRSALDLLERCDHGDPQRPTMLTTVKNLQLSIDKMKKEISAEQAQMTATLQNQQHPPPRKTKEQQKKELLDMELELIAQQQEGGDTTVLQKRIEELQRGLGVTGTGRTHFAQRNKHVRLAPPGSTSVDRRPTTIQILGFALEDSDLVLGHFKHFGEVTKNTLDKTVPSLTISFATRLTAEQAIARGRVFKEKQLQISWVTPPALTQQKSQDSSIAENEENYYNAPSPVYRGNEEEEEEDAESEDRSWRR